VREKEEREEREKVEKKRIREKRKMKKWNKQRCTSDAVNSSDRSREHKHS